MAPNRPSPRRHSRVPSIPLQDLTRPPDISINDGGGLGPRRSVSGRARELLKNRQSFHGRISTPNRYERVSEGSPTRGHESSPSDLPHVTTPRNAHQAPYAYEDGELSPVNHENFQAAISSVGLSFEPAGPSRSPIGTPSVSPGKRASTLGVITESEPASLFSNPFRQTTSETDENLFSPTDNDRTPLTDTRYLQPVSGSHTLSPSGQRHNRQGSRLGDDLPSAEAGLRPTSTYSARSLSRTLSTSGAASPLTRAGTIMRKMSQRVVNLSNEPDPVEQGRQAEGRQATLEEPPSFPALDVYAHDEPQRVPPSTEKARALVDTTAADDQWQAQHSPLRGRSLGIFAPDNKLRIWLCELLVKPFTEPVILVLIILQTLFLTIDATLDSPRHWLRYALLVLFIVFTLEICIKIIVSGFIKNADEYSTVNWNAGFGRTIAEQARRLFTPNRRSATMHAGRATDHQQSIVRSFTALQIQAGQSGNSRQQQRARLARRAFFRHSWNRLDMLAVVSFWIWFILEMLHVEQNRHVFLFRMLSCLRILRLLGLTSGTSVSSDFCTIRTQAKWP